MTGGQSTIGFLRALLRIAGGYWRGRTGPGAWALVAGQAALMLLQVAVAVRINLWSADLFNALERRSMDRFLTQLGIFALLVAAIMLSNAAHLELKRRLQLGWRRWLTEAVLQDWLAEGRHYRLALMPGDHTNPDGRIAEDIRIATEYAVDLANTLLYAVLLLVSFLSILWTLSGTLEFSFASHVVPVPGHMVALALVYAAGGGYAAYLLGRPLVRATDLRQGQEAGFRHGLVHVQDAGEAIALAQAEGAERRRLTMAFDGIAVLWRRQTASLRSLLLFSSGYATLAPMFPILVATPRFLAGDISLGGLMQTAQAFQQATQALSWPVDNAQRLAEWRASAERVLALAAGLERVAAPRQGGIAQAQGQDAALRLDALVLHGPDGVALCQPVTLALQPGQVLQLAGDPRAAGLLCKAIAGTWPWGEGSILLPAGTAPLLVVRRPYLSPARLLTLLAPDLPEAEVQAALRQVGLAALATALTRAADWETVLSGAEQQRLALARVLLLRPSVVLLDHALEELGEVEAGALLDALRAALPGSMLVMAGPLPPLARPPEASLALAPPGAPAPLPAAPGRRPLRVVDWLQRGFGH